MSHGPDTQRAHSQTAPGRATCSHVDAPMTMQSRQPDEAQPGPKYLSPTCRRFRRPEATQPAPWFISACGSTKAATTGKEAVPITVASLPRVDGWLHPAHRALATSPALVRRPAAVMTVTALTLKAYPQPSTFLKVASCKSWPP